MTDMAELRGSSVCLLNLCTPTIRGEEFDRHCPNTSCTSVLIDEHESDQRCCEWSNN